MSPNAEISRQREAPSSPTPMALLEDPPFLQERSMPLAATPPTESVVQRIAEVAYRQKAVTAVVLASLVLAVLAFAFRTDSPTAPAATPVPVGEPGPAGALVIPQVLRAIQPSTTIIDAGATTIPSPDTAPAGPDTAPASSSPSTEAPVTTPPTTIPTTSATTSAPTTPTTAAPTSTTSPVQTTALPTTPPPGGPGPKPPDNTIPSRFCRVVITEPTTVRSDPDPEAEAVDEVRFGIFPLVSQTFTDERWYQIDTGRSLGWVDEDSVDRRGDCRRE